MRLLSIFALLLVLAGCSASGPIYQEHISQRNDSSVVYIYRPKRVVNCCVSPMVYINDKEKHPLKNGGYLVYELDAGSHKITVGDSSYGFEAQSILLSLKPGTTHYLKWVVGELNQFDAMIYGNNIVGHGSRDYYLIEMPYKNAKEEISPLKLSARQSHQ